MKVNRRTKFNFPGVAFIVSLGLLTGCGVAYPEITEEEEAHVVEYATGLLLKYDKGHEHSLVDLEANKPEENQPLAKAGEPQEVLSAEDTEVVADIPDQPEVVDLTVPQTLSEIMAIDGIDFQYAGYEVSDSYPTDIMEFVVNASNQHKLLILKFNVTNNSGADFLLDMSQSGMRYKVGWNGEQTKNALVTWLLNDMASYKDEIPAGQTVELVVVAEVPEESADGINNIVLAVRGSEGINTTNL